ncbi:MAG: MFS transporter, partial [Chloroflexota bacterium]|nr:MFS transporter [Chloroflexota bacterium]
MIAHRRAPRTRIHTAWWAYAGFALFGSFWGMWGAAVPAVRNRADIGDGQLGTALLLVGAG